MRELKYVVAVALLAMSAVLMAGAAYGADDWTVTGQDIPSAMVWGATAAASVDADNTGDTTWDSDYALVSVMGPTLTPTAIDRWGLTSVPVEGTVAPDASYTWDFDVTAPPISTLAYVAPVGAADSGELVGLENNWTLANPYDPPTFVTTDMAAGETVITRFPDDQPGTSGGWAAFWIDELYGRAPLVVQGYPDGTYRPAQVVTRDQMAVYMARALNLPTAPYEGVFETTDVPEIQWAALYIEALVRADIVAGFPDGYYRPGWNVNRGQMATFVARGIWGGMDVPSGPEVGDFSDVPDYDPGPAHWAYDAIEYAVAHNVVQGYPGGTYRPDNNVTRDQMAVFVWKGFVMPTPGSTVVLAGPAVTLLDPETAEYDGWTSLSAVQPDDPRGTAYVGLDATRLDTSLVGPDDSFDITFNLLDAGDLTDVVATGTVSKDAEWIQTVHDAAVASGNPYAYVSWAIPEDVPLGLYLLQVTFTDASDTASQGGGLFEYWLASPPVTVTAEWGGDDYARLRDERCADSTPSDLVLYPEDNMAASDDEYFRSQRNTFPDVDWCGAWAGPDTGTGHAHAIAWLDIPADAVTLQINLEFYIDPLENYPPWGSDVDCCATNCCAEWGDPIPPSTDPPYGWGCDVRGPDNVSGVWEPFLSLPTTDTAYEWHGMASDFVYPDGTLLLRFCGGSYAYVYVDQATLTYQQ